MTHSKGLSLIEKTIDYIKKQKKGVPAILMVLVQCCNITPKKGLQTKNYQDFFYKLVDFPCLKKVLEVYIIRYLSSAMRINKLNVNLYFISFVNDLA